MICEFRYHRALDLLSLRSADVSTADILGIIAIVAGVIGIGVAIFYGRRALRPPERLIQWYSDATPMMSRRSAQYRDVIEVSISGQKVNDPYIGRLIVENVGQHDIESSSFDKGRPIRFRVDHQGSTGTFLDQENNPPGLRVDGDFILVGPELLRSKSKWILSFITDGRPTVKLVNSYLINVKIDQRLVSDYHRGDWVGYTITFIGIIIGALTAATIIAIGIIGLVNH